MLIAWCLTKDWWTALKNSNNQRRQVISFDVAYARFNIHQKASWLLRIINCNSLRCSRNSRMAYKNGRHSVVLAFFNKRDKYSRAFYNPSGCSCSKNASDLLVTCVGVKRIAFAWSLQWQYCWWQRSMLYCFECLGFNFVQSFKA